MPEYSRQPASTAQSAQNLNVTKPLVSPVQVRDFVKFTQNCAAHVTVNLEGVPALRWARSEAKLSSAALAQGTVQGSAVKFHKVRKSSTNSSLGACTERHKKPTEVRTAVVVIKMRQIDMKKKG